MSDAGTRIIRVVERKTKEPAASATLVFGKVESVSPLRIVVDSKLVVTEEFILVSPFCVETKMLINHTHSYEGGQTEEAFSEPYQLWRGLATGDTVAMLSLNSGQLYYVLQRAGGISDS